MTNTSRNKKRSSSARKPRNSAGSPAARVTLEEQLLQAVTRAGGNLVRVGGALARLERKWGGAVYPAFIRLLTRLEFQEPAARKHWETAREHAESLEARLGRNVDFRIALADYFVSRHKKIRHPMVLEIHLYQRSEAERLTDGLTGLFNFRYMKGLLPRMFAHAKRTGHPLGLAFFDLDDFKAYNDRYGHEGGNDLLQKAAGVLTGAVREMDVVCRYGGEEFAILLPGADKLGALAVAERVRTGLERLALPGGRPGKKVTLSGGIACYPGDGDSAEALLQAADSAMYHAKSLGKNRVELAVEERRLAERIHGAFTARCTLDRASFKIRGENLAPGGCYGVSERAVEVGSSVAVSLDVPGVNGRRAVVSGRAVVSRCEPLDRGHFGVALLLTDLSEEDRKRFETALAACSSP